MTSSIQHVPNPQLKHLQYLLFNLAYVRDNAHVRFDYAGICLAVKTAESYTGKFIGNTYSALATYFRRWPEFSGRSDYPIKGLIYSPTLAFSQMDYAWSKWSIYGRRRWRLLHFVIAEVKKDIYYLERDIQNAQS